jgi:hypothetical protein
VDENTNQKNWLLRFGWVLNLENHQREFADTLLSFPDEPYDVVAEQHGVSPLVPKRYVYVIGQAINPEARHNRLDTTRQLKEARDGLSSLFKDLKCFGDLHKEHGAKLRQLKAAKDKLLGADTSSPPSAEFSRPEAGTSPVLSPEEAIRALSEQPQPEYQAPLLTKDIVERLVKSHEKQIEAAKNELDGYLLELHGRKYPVVVYRAPENQPLESLLPEALVDARPSSGFSEFIARDPIPRIRKELRRLGIQEPRLDDLVRAEQESFHGFNLCMRKIDRTDGGRLVMHARTGTYGQIMDTCDALIDEAAYAGSASQMLRRAILSNAEENPLLSAEYRAAGIGIAALLCYEYLNAHDEIELHCLLGLRSYRVGTYPATLHVAPAGMFNWRFDSYPPNGTASRHYGSYHSGDLRLSILSEYAEELFNRKELDRHTSRKAVEQCEPVVALEARKARLLLTGVAMDLGNLRAEVCMLIYVPINRSARLQTRFNESDLERNEEYQKPIAGRENFIPIDITTDESSEYAWLLNLLAPDKTVPAGAAAFSLGVEAARRIFRDRHRRSQRSS